MDKDFLSNCRESLKADGGRAKYVRTTKQLAQLDLAAQADCSIQLVQKLEQNKGAIKVFNLFAISKVLGLELVELLTEESKEKLRQIYARHQDPLGMDPRKPANQLNLFQLPSNVPNFVGRVDEQEEMIAALTGGKTVAVAAAKGMGGVGKTSLAVRVAHAVKGHYPDGQLVLDMQGTAESPLAPAQAMARVIASFHPDAKLPEGNEAVAGIYRGVLTDKKVFILIDNAKDKSQVAPLLTAGPQVGFLVTSRKSIAVPGLTVSLEVLEPQEAFALLRNIVGEKATDADLNEIAELTGYLPLALRVAGDFLRLHTNWSPTKYIAALKDEARKWDKLNDGERNVKAVLTLSAARLLAENRQLAEYWQMLSVFPADFDAIAAAAVMQLDANAADDALTSLLDSSLIQYDEKSDRYDLHDLMKPISREVLPISESADQMEQAELSFAEHYCTVLVNAGALYKQGNENIIVGLKWFDREAANIRHGRAWAVKNGLQGIESASALRLVAEFADAGVYIINLRLLAHERIKWMEDQLVACRKLGSRRGEGNALVNLGTVWSVLSEVRKAIEFYEQGLVLQP